MEKKEKCNESRKECRVDGSKDGVDDSKDGANGSKDTVSPISLSVSPSSSHTPPPLSFFLDCVEDDNKKNKQSKPALRKLEYLDLFVKTLLNKKYQDSLLEDNVLGVVRRWLEPLPDKSLPNIKIRKSLLETLRLLPVEKNQLLESGVGKIVHFYSLNPKENLEVKKLALEIIQKWTRRVGEGE